MTEDDWFESARSFGPMDEGVYRVVVLESNLDWKHRDFPSFQQARTYADDAAAEEDDDGNRPLARVFDDAFQAVHVGRPYYAR